MKNVIFLVLDSLSREYIEKYPLDEDNFFQYLDNNSICFKNMYSMAPFTEGALAHLILKRMILNTCTHTHTTTHPTV